MKAKFQLMKLFTGFIFLIFFSNSILAQNWELTIDTKEGGKGKVIIKLLPDVAPNHVERIKKLTNEGKYNQIAFHRAIGGFMVQSGDIQYGRKENYNHARVGTGKSSYPDLYAELSEIAFDTGVVGMARGGRYINSANSQFFIMTDRHPSLDSLYSVFGIVVEGMDVIRDIKLGPQFKNGKVDDPDFIVEAKIID